MLIPGPSGVLCQALIIHDLRRLAIWNLIAAGMPEKVCIAISDHKTREVFDRYHIHDTTDVRRAMRRVLAAAQALLIPASKVLPLRERKGRA